MSVEVKFYLRGRRPRNKPERRRIIKNVSKNRGIRFS